MVSFILWHVGGWRGNNKNHKTSLEQVSTKYRYIDPEILQQIKKYIDQHDLNSCQDTVNGE